MIVEWVVEKRKKKGRREKKKRKGREGISRNNAVESDA